MNKQIQFRILVNVKQLNGVFGSKITYREEFWFCCESAGIARELASSNVKSKGWPNEEVSLEIIDAIHVSRDPFAGLSRPLLSIREAESELEELEFA